MKIYFAGSIRGGRDDEHIYSDIIEYLGTYGEVLTEHVGYNELTSFGEKQMTDRQIHDRDIEWLSSADAVVAEVTVPSLGVGYEIGLATQLDKKILCLYRLQQGKRLSAMISGCSKVVNREYQRVKEAKGVIDGFFAKKPLSH